MIFKNQQFKKLSVGLLLILAITLVGCSANPVSGKKDFSLISKDQEVAMGAQGHRDILKTMKHYNNAGLQAYVNNIGQALARKSHRSGIRYTFTVLDDPTVNERAFNQSRWLFTVH